MIRGASGTRIPCGAGWALRRSAGLVALSVLPAALAAQVRSSVVLGGVRVRYADALDLSAFTLSPAVTVQDGLSLFGASATLSQPSGGTWSGQALLSGSAYRTLSGPFAAELGGAAGGSTTGDGARTGHVQATVRGHLVSARVGGWAGGSLGSAWNGATWQSTRSTEVGVWVQGVQLGLSASYVPAVANDSVRYADAVIGLRWRGVRLELDGTLGHRGGGARAMGVSDPSDWVSASASWRVSDRTALIASGGTYPLDLLQGFPSGRFASLGVRLTGPGTGPSPEFARTTAELERDRLMRAGVGALRTRRLGGGRVELRVRASGARRMELTGDLTGWEPVAMHAEPDGWWSLILEGAPGTYEVTVRRDGGAWVVPLGMLERRDEFGGVSGVLSLR